MLANFRDLGGMLTIDGRRGTVWAPLMRADPAALDTLRATLEERYGSLYWFLEVELGVGRAERQRLRGLPLEDREK